MTAYHPPIPPLAATNEPLVSAAYPVAPEFPGFVDWSHRLYPAGLREVGIHLITFRPESFRADAHCRTGIPMPAAISRSVRKRQAEYFYGRLAARMALADLGIHTDDIGSGTNREPLWPTGAIGSITHSQRQAAAIALPIGIWQGVGIDLEGAVGAEAIGSVEQLALCAAELDVLSQLPQMPHNILVALVFSAKESFFKATFAAVGRYFGFEAIRITGVDIAGRRLHFTTVETLCSAWPSGKRGIIGFTLLDAAVLTAFVWK
jgi:enterobactin synthetase component D